MRSATIASKLEDPAYLDLHMTAVASCARVGTPKWYDALFHRRYQAARIYLSEVRPEALRHFESEFEKLIPDPDFEVKKIDNLFDADTTERIAQTVRSMPHGSISNHEIKSFGRQVVQDDPYFLQLQSELLPLVSDLVQKDLVLGYNFLSLYGGSGSCALHMDEPFAMYTLDYCIEQSAEWPIHFSNVTDWPSTELMNDWQPRDVLEESRLTFSSHALKPNNAVIFNGSSQWHYRDKIEPGAFCNLLFFHYYPKGCENLVRPARWSDHFSIPELVPLCDLFVEETAKA